MSGTGYVKRVVLSPLVTIYQGDARAFQHVPLCDAIITDPPYGMAHPCDYKARGRGALAECKDWPDVHGDAEPFDPAWLLALARPTVLWGANYYADRLPPSPGWLVWDKERPDDLDQSTCELAWTNCVKGVRRFSHLWNGMMKASEKGESYHPTQKPVALMAWTLGLRWLAGIRSVYDPYMGAGPMGVACVRAGIAYVGVELNPDHFATAQGRLEREL